MAVHDGRLSLFTDNRLELTLSMAPPYLFDISAFDVDNPMYGVDKIESINPHRGAMRLIDAIIWEDDSHTHAVAYKDVRDDEFWVPGHIPGRPIFPGVLMIEAAAQLASFVTLSKMEGQRFMGFAGVNGVKFRGQVQPGDRLILLANQTESRPRRSICDTQGWVDGTLVFEAEIIGMPM